MSSEEIEINDGGHKFAFAVSSGNIRQAVTAADYFEAAKKAVLAHYNDSTAEPINPGLIFSVIREGDQSGDETYFDTERVMSGAGFGLVEESKK